MDDCTRTKRKLRRLSSQEDIKNDDFMKIIQNLPVYPYQIENIHHDKNRVYANLAFMNNPTIYNYMDNQVREICFVLAEILRDHAKRNVYFDLVKGNLTFFI